MARGPGFLAFRDEERRGRRDEREAAPFPVAGSEDPPRRIDSEDGGPCARNERGRVRNRLPPGAGRQGTSRGEIEERPVEGERAEVGHAAAERLAGEGGEEVAAGKKARDIDRPQPRAEPSPAAGHEEAEEQERRDDELGLAPQACPRNGARW